MKSILLLLPFLPPTTSNQDPQDFSPPFPLAGVHLPLHMDRPSSPPVVDSSEEIVGLPSYQARLLSGSSSSSSLSRSSSSRHNILSSNSPFGTRSSTLGRVDSVPSGVDSLSRTTSTRWNGRGHTSGSKSVDVTRGFWQEREKAAAAEATATEEGFGEHHGGTVGRNGGGGGVESASMVSFLNAAAS